MATNGNGHGNLQNVPASNFFTNITAEGVQVAYGKFGFEGPQGSGKTTTAGLLAAGISKQFYNGAPVMFVGGEKGVNFTRPIFVAEGIPLLAKITKSLSTLKEAFVRAEAEGVKVAVVDPITLFWTTLVSDYMKEHKISNMKYMMSHWATVKEPWREWVQVFLDCNMHVIVCGRGGFEYDEITVVDDEGNVNTETVKGDNKMKAEGEFGYEPDVNLHFESMDDPNAPRTGKLQRKHRRGNKTVRGEVELVAPRRIHVANVTKGRVWQLNGKVFTWTDRDEYKQGEYKLVLDCFLPYLNALNIGGNHQQTERGDNPFKRCETNGTYLRKKEAIETWDATMSILFPSQAVQDKQRRKLVGERITGTLSKTAFERQDVDAIKFQVLHLNKLRERLGSEGFPVLEKDQIALIELTHQEAGADWADLHPPDPPPLTEQEMEQPF